MSKQMNEEKYITGRDRAWQIQGSIIGHGR